MVKKTKINGCGMLLLLSFDAIVSNHCQITISLRKSKEMSTHYEKQAAWIFWIRVWFSWQTMTLKYHTISKVNESTEISVSFIL